MVKHTQTIWRLLPTNCLSVFDYFMGLALKGLIHFTKTKITFFMFSHFLKALQALGWRNLTKHESKYGFNHVWTIDGRIMFKNGNDKPSVYHG